MATRIFCLAIAIAFLASVVGFSVYMIYRYATAEEQTPKTIEEVNEERLAALQDLGSLEEFSPLDGERLTERKFEELAASGGGLRVVGGDIVTVRFEYALAQTGQIFTNSQDPQNPDSDTFTYAVGRHICPGWPESIVGLGIGGKRRLFVPAAAVGDCNVQAAAWPADHDLVIDIELVALADRPLEGFEPLSEPLSELEIEDLIEGSGREVVANDQVKVNYIGVLAVSGAVFDDGQEYTFSLAGGVIVGWQEGLIGMKVGGKRRLLIPAEKAYGADGQGSTIPPNADLAFDIELLDIVTGEAGADVEQ